MNLAIAQIRFPIQGDFVHTLNGYLVYSALKSELPWIGERQNIQIATIPGHIVEPGKLAVGSGSLVVRCPVELASNFYKLTNKKLRIGSYQISLGLPFISPLKVAPNLRAYMVRISRQEKENLAIADFLNSVNRQLEAMGVSQKAKVLLDINGQPKRKILKLKDNKLVGYSVGVNDLSFDESLALQAIGVGANRKMGCGIFFACRA